MHDAPGHPERKQEHWIEVMPHLSLPNEVQAREVIKKRLEAMSPGLLPNGVTVTKHVGPYSVQFTGRRTRTSFEIGSGVYVKLRGNIRSVGGELALSLGKTFDRGMWEADFGVEPIRYLSHSSALMPDELVRGVRRAVDCPASAKSVLSLLKEAMDGMGEYVDCIQQRSGGAALINIICNQCSDVFLVALAVVLRFGGARSDDVQCIFDFAGEHGADTSGLLGKLLESADRIAKFEALMAIAPDDEQSTLLLGALENQRDVLHSASDWLRSRMETPDFSDLLALMLEREGLMLVSKSVFEDLSGRAEA